jgi:hypothetical protein
MQVEAQGHTELPAQRVYNRYPAKNGKETVNSIFLLSLRPLRLGEKKDALKPSNNQ